MTTITVQNDTVMNQVFATVWRDIPEQPIQFNFFHSTMCNN